MTLAEHIESYTPPADEGCLAAVPAREAANDNVSVQLPKGSGGGAAGYLPTPADAQPIDGPGAWAAFQKYGGSYTARSGLGTERWEPPATPAAIRPTLNFDHLPRVIALSGAAGSGKSTVSDFLAVRLGYRKTKFAAPLKDMCRAIGMTEAMIEGDQKEVPQDWLGGKTPRYLMQRLGTEFGRDCMGDDFWVDLWERAAQGRVIVDDCRFANEAARVRRLGGRVIRLTGRGGIAGGHVSEQVNFIADAVIENTGTIAELQARVLEVIEGWREG